MADEFLSIETTGLESILPKISSFPKDLQHQIIDDVTPYAERVIKESYAPQKYVTRKEAYGATFFTPKQRRYFFYALNAGIIKVPYTRTYGLRDSWKVQRSEDTVTISTNYPAAPYVMGFATQSRHEARVGWKKITDILNGQLSFRSSSFRNVVMAAVQKVIRAMKFG